MKKLFTLATLLSLVSCGIKEYKNTVEVIYNNGEKDTLIIESSITPVILEEGDIKAKGYTVVSGVRSFKIISKKVIE